MTLRSAPEHWLLRVAGAGLSIAIWIAVIAFGGVSPPFFFPSQLIILGLAVALLCANLGASLELRRFPVVVPVALVAWVVLQILPLPAFMASRSESLHHSLAEGTHQTLSIAPYQTASHLLLLFTYTTAFYLTLLVSRNSRAQQRLVYILAALGVFEAFYGLAQYLTGWQRIFAYVKKYYLEDATGTYINRNHFAGFLEMVLPFAVALAARQAAGLRSAALRGDAKLRSLLIAKGFLPFVFWLFLSVLLFIAIVFSRSRMGIISAGVSLIVVLGLAGSTSLSLRTRAGAVVLLLLCIVAVVVWVGSDPVILRFENLGREYQRAGQNRLSIWRDTIALIHQHPFFGTGLGTFSVAYTSMQTVFLTHLVDHAHCDYLEVASELGLPGTVLVFGPIFWILVRAVRRYRKVADGFAAAVCLSCIGSIAAILLHSLADFNLYIPANALVFSVVLALAWNGTESSRPAAPDGAATAAD